MKRFTIVRVRRHGKPLRAAELMHNGIYADSQAEALARYHIAAPDVDLRDVEAREG